MNFPIAKAGKDEKTKFNSENVNDKNMSPAQCIQQSIFALQAEIDSKRIQDEQLLEQFKQEIDIYVANLYEKVQLIMDKKFAESNAAMESKVQELTQVVMRINNLETDLVTYRQAVASFFQNLQDLD